MSSTVPSNPYAVLGIASDASLEEVRTAYRKLALKWHPDRHAGDKAAAAEKFVEIHDAYLLLTESSPASPVQVPSPLLSQHDPPVHTERTQHASSRYSSVPDNNFPINSPSSRREEIFADAPRYSTRNTSSTSLPVNSRVSSHIASSSTLRPPPTHRHTDAAVHTSTRKHTVPLSKKTSSPSLAPSSRSRRTEPAHAESDRSSTHSRSRSKHSSAVELKQPHRKRSSTRNPDISQAPSKSRELDYVHVPTPDSTSPLDPPLQPLAPPKPASSKSIASEWTFPLDLTLEELYTGASQKYRISTGPDGAYQNVRVIVPPGLLPGARIHALPTVVFEVRERPHGYFRRVPGGHNTDLFMAVELPWSPSAEWPLGHVAFTGVDGNIAQIPLPQNLVLSSQGTRFVGKGMPKRQGDKVIGYGDLIIRWDLINIDVEKSLAARSKWDAFKKVLHITS